ncbi:MAG: DUF6263 family protein [Planctomycetes bacterium]|nr:DUF6263 family protein [Planctomycetota bacterium]
MQVFVGLSRVRLLIAAVAVMSIASGAMAQEPLRWKFEKGAKFDYNMVQDMTIGSMGGPLGAQNVTMHQELGMTWDVQDVSKEGDAVIQQKIDRVKMKMTLPAPVGAIEYDSSSEKLPVGPAAMLAPMYKAMTQGAFTITMTPRGEIKDVKIPDEVVAALKNSPGAAAMGDMATADGFKKMISQGSLVLPEGAPKQGEEWTTKVEVNNPAAGKQIVETTYRYEGTKDVEGVKFAEFQPTIKMNFEGAQVKISEQASDGEILFNVVEGRLDSSKLEQHVTIDQPGGGQTKIDQEIVVSVKPAGEKKEEKPAAEATK